jgi:Na+/pantothenate symporter
MTTSDVPGDIDKILDFIGGKARAYNYLKWNEQAMLKADMMNVPARWISARISPDRLQRKAVAVGLTAEEAAEVADWLRKRQAGRKLVPRSQYRTWKFNYELED